MEERGGEANLIGFSDQWANIESGLGALGSR